MKTNRIQPSRLTRRLAAALILVLAASTASALAWDKQTVINSYNGFIAKFRHTFPDGNYGFDSQENDGSGSTGSFWEDAEEIEMVEDFYYWDQSNNSGANAATLKDTITKLCNGFIHDQKGGRGTDWSGNQWNDDLCWACIAFARATQITGDHTFVNIAGNNLTTVWNRARINNDALHYGLRQNQIATDPQANVNFGFVVAGYLVEDNGGGSFKSHADDVYRWAAVPQYNLLQTSGKVRDSLPPNTTDYAYNYGIALNAATRESDSASCQIISYYLRYNFGGGCYPYNAPAITYNGKTLNVLPNYAHNSCDGTTDRGGNNVGYDGICFRGMGLAISRGYLAGTDSTVWAQGNVNQANSIANGDDLMWTDWQGVTESSGNYSWSCSSAVSAMANTPLP